MDQALKAHLEGMETRLLEHGTGVETRLLDHVKGGEVRLREHVSQECEKIERKLLTAFHMWASPMEVRMRSHTAALRALDIEQEFLAERI